MSILIKYKWLALVLAVVFMLVIDSMVYNVSISHRGIAIGLGIDIEEGEISLTAQVVLPKNGGVSSGGNNFINYNAKAKDMEKAIDIIGAESGLELSVAHTSIIVVGKSVIESARYDLFRYFISDDKINDNVLIAMAEDKAADVMKAKVPVGEVASLQLLNQLSPAKHPLGLIAVNLKDFTSRMFCGQGENYLPIVSIIPTTPSSDQSKDKVDKADAFKMDKTAIMDKEGLKGELDSKGSEGLSLITNNLQDGVIDIVGSDDRDISVHIVDSKSGVKYDYKNRKYKVNLALKTSRSEGRYEPDNTYSYLLDDQEIADLQKGIIDRVSSVISYSEEIGVDILGIKEGFYRYNPKQKYNIMTDDFLKTVKLEINFKIIQR